MIVFAISSILLLPAMARLYSLWERNFFCSCILLWVILQIFSVIDFIQ